MMFALWGVSLAAEPIYIGGRNSEVLKRLGIRGVETDEIVLSKDERYLVSLELGDLMIWHNLSLAPEANDRGILPGGCLESWLGR
jgi:hypothetical protein